MTPIITKLIYLFVSFFDTRKILLIGLMFLTAAVGLITDRFFVGVVAWIAGSIQFIALVIYIYLMLIYYIFRSNFQERAISIQRGRLQLFVLLSVIAGYFIVFTVFYIANKPWLATTLN